MKVLVSSIILLVFGIILGIAGRPQKYKWWLGYRTVKTCKSPEAWVFANALFGKLILLSGLIGLTLSVAVIKEGDETFEFWAVGALLVGFIASIIITQVEMSKSFDKEGVKKQ